jgi:hypothetical protein
LPLSALSVEVVVISENALFLYFSYSKTERRNIFVKTNDRKTKSERSAILARRSVMLAAISFLDFMQIL